MKNHKDGEVGMTREEAINKLEHLINSPVGREEIDETCYEVMKYLVAQKPRVMTWAEAQANVNEGPFIIFEVRDSTGSEVDFGVLVGDFYEMSEKSVLTVADFGMMKGDYGKRFRLWTSRPTDEQMEATPWN